MLQDFREDNRFYLIHFPSNIYTLPRNKEIIFIKQLSGCLASIITALKRIPKGYSGDAYALSIRKKGDC